MCIRNVFIKVYKQKCNIHAYVTMIVKIVCINFFFDESKRFLEIHIANLYAEILTREIISNFSLI